MKQSTHDQRLTQTLQEVAARDIPENLDLWPVIRYKAGGRFRRAWLRRPPLVLARAALVTALLLAVGLAAYTLAPFLGEGSASFLEGAYPTLDANRVLRRNIDGYQVTLQSVSDGPYIAADANQLLLVVMLTDPQGRRLRPGEFMITDDAGGAAPRLLDDGAGSAIRWRGATVYAPSDGTEPQGPARYEYGLVFDTGGRAELPAAFHLHLILTLRVKDDGLGDSGPSLTRRTRVSTPISAAPPGDAPGLGRVEPARWQEIGPVGFTFRLPLDPVRRVAPVHQTIQAAGVPLTLERVVITRSEARAVLRFPSPDDRPAVEWSPVTVDLRGYPDRYRMQLSELNLPELHAGGWQADGTWIGSNIDPAELLLNQETEWRLTVQSLEPAAPETPVVRGPWIFDFTLPPATSAVTEAGR